MLMIVTTTILAILAVILLSGKGGFLVAGYNILSKKEKQNYNEKKISRIMGVFLSYIVIGLATDILLGQFLANHSNAVFIGAVLLLFISITIAYKIWKKDF